MSGIIINDYHAEDAAEVQDPYAPEAVERPFMNKLGTLVTYAEEALQAGEMDVNSDEFYDRRGNFLDLLNDPQMQQWLMWMRQQKRCPFRRFSLAAEDPETDDADETEEDV